VPARIYNIGAGRPSSLLDFVETLERHLGKVAEKEYVGMQAGDVEKTFADTTALERDYGYRADTTFGRRHRFLRKLVPGISQLMTERGKGKGTFRQSCRQGHPIPGGARTKGRQRD
jgi:hypothetical protein